MSRSGIAWLLSVLLLSGCSGPAIYYGPAPKASATIIEGDVRHYGLSSERVEITAVDRLAGGGIAHAELSKVTRAEVEPGERCVQLEIRKCGAPGLGSCGEPTFCAFSDYFVAGQRIQLKGGSLKLDAPASAEDSVVDGTIQIEVTSADFAPQTRRINMRCGNSIPGVCERGTPALPRQALPWR